MRSLLYADTPPRSTERPPWDADLALEPLARALALNQRYLGATRAVLLALSTDPATIARRQDALADLLAAPALAARIEPLLPQLNAAAAAGSTRWPDEGGILTIAGRLAELEAYISAVGALRAVLAELPLRAAAWRELVADLDAIASSAEFRALELELPALRGRLERAGSVTIGVNLDAQLRPESATLLEIAPGRFGGPRSLLGRLLGPERDKQAGLTPLRQAGERQALGPERQLFLDLSALLDEIVAPLATALGAFARVSGAALAPLEGELAFLLGAARLVTTLRAENYPLVRPTIVPAEQRRFQAQGLYNLELALRLRTTRTSAAVPAAPVANDAAFDDDGRIFVLTGPNRGGKTTFARAVGLAHVLAQAGLPVPAVTALISPVDAIFTLFPAAESARTGMGRLDEEAAALATIFRRATAQSLVLLNEPLGSTSPHEALTIARDLLCGLRMLGARALFVTHLHELAHEAAALNRAVAGPSTIDALVAGAEPEGDGHARTYRISRGLPDGRSYAADIALAHGLQLDQLARTLRERGVAG